MIRYRKTALDPGLTWDQGSNCKKRKQIRCHTNGLMMYDSYKVCDKSVFIDCLKEREGLETEEVNAAMVERGHEQRQLKP